MTRSKLAKQKYNSMNWKVTELIKGMAGGSYSYFRCVVANVLSNFPPKRNLKWIGQALGHFRVILAPTRAGMKSSQKIASPIGTKSTKKQGFLTMMVIFRIFLVHNLPKPKKFKNWFYCQSTFFKSFFRPYNILFF